MKEIERIKKEIRNNIQHLKDEYKVKTIGVFGSCVREDQKKGSDVDILIEFEEPISLLEFIALERQLGKILGKKVDLVMKTALKPRIGKHILNEVVYI